jgi:hypothetical protein
MFSCFQFLIKFTWQIFVSMFTLASATLANVVSLAFSLGITL